MSLLMPFLYLLRFNLAYTSILSVTIACYLLYRILLMQQRPTIPPTPSSGSIQGISQAVQQQQQQQQRQPQHQQQQQSNQQQESLCSEMAREFCRTLRCHTSSRRRRTCDKCSTHVIGYSPDNPTATPINGIRSQVTSSLYADLINIYLIV